MRPLAGKMRSLLAWVLATPPVEGPGFIGWIFPWRLGLGAFGVAVFFLISSFMILFSLEKADRVRPADLPGRHAARPLDGRRRRGLHVAIEGVSIDAGRRLTRGAMARPVLRRA